MLHHLIENFDTEFLEAFEADQRTINECFEAEYKKLSDTEHLEQNVIDEPLLAWDYRAIEPGLLELMDPFMESESHTPLLFFSILRDLGLDPKPYVKASLLLEYSYFALGVIDYFDFHKVFTEKKQDLLTYSELTQVRYAAQYLIQYPRYLVIKNSFELSKAQNIALHKLYATIGVTTGIGRGAFLKWGHDYFVSLIREHYFQNSIYTLNNYFLFPAMLGAIIADLSDAQKDSLQKGFSALTMFAKLRLEKRYYENQDEFKITPPIYRDLWQLLSFPGMALMENGLQVDPAPYAEDKYPWFTGLYRDLNTQIQGIDMADTIKTMEKLETELFETFVSELGRVDLLPATVERLRNCYRM